MPPKKKQDGASKKTQEKVKQKIVEASVSLGAREHFC